MADDLFTREIELPLAGIFKGAEKEANRFFKKLAGLISSADVKSLKKAFEGASKAIDASTLKASKSIKEASNDITAASREQEKAAERLEKAAEKISKASKDVAKSAAKLGGTGQPASGVTASAPPQPSPPSRGLSKRQKKEQEFLAAEEQMFLERARRLRQEAKSAPSKRAENLEKQAVQDVQEAARIRQQYVDNLKEYSQASVNSLKRMQEADEAAAAEAVRAAKERSKARKESAARAEQEARGFTREDISARVSAPRGPGGTGTGGMGGGRPPEPPVDKWVASIQKLWNAITKQLDKIDLSDLDISTVLQAAPYRKLAGRHAEEYRKERPTGLVSPEDVSKLYSEIQTTTNDKMNALVRNLSELLKAAEAPGLDPASIVSRTIRDIKKLTSKSEVGIDIKSTKQLGTYMKTTSDLVQGALKKIVSKLLDENLKLEKAVREASAAGKEVDVQSAARQLVANINQMQEVYNAIEQGGAKFNINLQRTTKGVPGRPPSPIPEAQFRYRDYSAQRTQREFERERPVVLEATKAARDFEGMADEADRIKAVFDILLAKMGPESLEFRKNITGVIEALKIQAAEGLIDRAEVERTVKTLETYLNKTRDLRLGEVGLGKTAAVKIPAIFELGGRGGTEKELLRQVERVRGQLFSTLKKKDPVIVPFEIQDPSGAIRKINVEYRQLGNTLGTVTTKARETTKALTGKELLGQAFKRVALWGTAAGLTYGAISALSELVTVMTEAESGVISLSKVMIEADEQGLARFSERINKFVTGIGVKFAASLKDAYEAMRIFGQQGKNLAEVMKLTEASFLGANVSVLNQKEVAEALTAATKQFNIEASDSTGIIDSWNEVANRNAVTMKTLADATMKAGSAAKVVGVEFEQFIGLVTAISEATRQPGKEIGTSLRFIFQRTLRPETQKELSRVGVSTTDLQGNFKGFIPVLTELADGWDTLGKAQQLAVAQALGGARQYNVFLALMNNFDTAMKASAEATDAQGSAMRENQKYMQSAEARFKAARAALHSLYVGMSSSLLPVIKSVTDGVGSLLKVFDGIPNVLKLGTVGFIGMASAVSALASRFDMVFDTISGGAGGASMLGDVLGTARRGLVGAGLQEEQIGSLAQKVSLTPSTRAGKQIADFSKSTAGAYSKLGFTLVDVGKNADVTTGKISKLSAYVKGFGLRSAETGATAAIALSDLNSPITKLIGFFIKLGKFATAGLLSMVGALSKGVATILTFGKAASGVSAVFAGLQKSLSGAGIAASLGIFAAIAAAIYGIIKAVEALKEATRKTGKETEDSLSKELASREKSLRSMKAQMSSLERFASRQGKLNRLRQKTSTGAQDTDYVSPVLEQLKLAESMSKAGFGTLSVNPAAIKSVDKFGSAVLDVNKSLTELARTAVESKAALVALTKTKIASAYAKEATDAFDKLKLSVKDLQEVLPAVRALSSLGVDVSGLEGYSEVVSKAQENQQKFNDRMAATVATVKGFPKSTPVESFVGALHDKDVAAAFSLEAERLSKSLVGVGLGAATAGDLMNKLFLTVKGFKGVELTGEKTALSLIDKKVVAKTFKDIEEEVKKGGEGIKGGELLVFGPEGPFGLKQARVLLDTEGKVFVEGINKFSQVIKKSLTDIRSEITDESKALIFDPSSLVQQLNNSILKAKKQLAGAGAGLISLPIKLELGTKFKFELEDVDKLQTFGKAAQDMVIQAAGAQEEYNKRLDQFVQTAKKQDAFKKIATNLQNSLNETARVAGQNIFFVRVASEISNLAFAAEKAAYDLRKANLGDAIEQQFAPLTTTAKGFSKALTFEPLKVASQLTPQERVGQTNPQLVKSIRGLDRALNFMKEQTKAMETVLSIDLPKMFSESAFGDIDKFFDKADQERKVSQEKSISGRY
jgi:TP901 family phage tail tape measure protein